MGFEECPPSEQDIRLLKDASQSFTKQMLTDGRLEDETGQGPPEEATHEDYQPALEPAFHPPTVSMTVPARQPEQTLPVPGTPSPQTPSKTFTMRAPM